jgi:enolase-phosphatase E1
VIEILLGWITEDRKATSLKNLQGHIWKNGYEIGAFTGHVYADAASNLRKWADDGIALFVYSSGSVGAQKLLFGHSDAGDLQPLFKEYFDTGIGHKKDSGSYENIIGKLGISAEEILFLSDVADELDAAAAAGMQTIQLIRDDMIVPGSHRIAKDFDEVTCSLRVK